VFIIFVLYTFLLLFFVTEIFPHLLENKQFVIDLLINKMLTSLAYFGLSVNFSTSFWFQFKANNFLAEQIGANMGLGKTLF